MRDIGKSLCTVKFPYQGLRSRVPQTCDHIRVSLVVIKQTFCIYKYVYSSL